MWLPVQQHPAWAAGGVRNTDPKSGYRYCEYVMAHELGHCLGLNHTNEPGENCTSQPFVDPPLVPHSGDFAQTNNIMDGASMPGCSFSQCQIGKMHYYLGHGGEGVLDNKLAQDYCQHVPAEDVTIKAGQAVVWESAHNLRGNLYIETGASLTVKCRLGFVGPEAKIVVREGGELILDNGTIGNYATRSLQECSEKLLLWLGGDGSDGDNNGLITIRNGGGFTSAKLDARLMTGATLHIGPVPVLLDACLLTTLEGSYLCVEPGATFSYVQQAQLTIHPATNLGMNPAITGTPADCQNDMCALLAQLTTFTASTSQAGTTVLKKICPGSPVTFSVQGVETGGYSVKWFRNGTIQPTSGATYTDTPTGTASIEYSAELTYDNGCPPVIWSCTQPLAPAASIQLLSNTVSVCADGHDTDDLFTIANAIRNASAPANQGMSYEWSDPLSPSMVIPRNPLSGLPVHPQLKTAAIRALGLSTYQLQLCNSTSGQSVSCTACATVTFNLEPGPPFTVSSPVQACAGQPVTLQASNGPVGTAYKWQPGNVSGASLTVAPTSTTTYTVTGTLGTGGCPTVKQVTVTVRPATCLDCLANNYIDVNSAGNTFSSYTFTAGKTYVFGQSTTLTTGTFLVPEGTRLLFDAGVKLTLSSGALLDLRGGQLTSICDEMWDGIVAEAGSRGVVSQKPANVTYSEISHSRNGLVLTSNASNWTPPALQLIYVAFLHNGQGVQVLNQAPPTSAFTGLIDNCKFDSDPHQMRSPWQYVSAQDLHVSLRHLAFAGNCAGLTVSNSTLDHALFGVWVPTAAPFTATNNEFRNFYVAGVYAHDLLTPDTHLTLNKFSYPPASNEIVRSRSPQLLAVFDNDLAAEGPISLLREGACVGIFGPSVTNATGPTFTLEGNEFTQAVAAIDYNYQTPYPQHGVIITGGVVRENIFRNLLFGYRCGSTQAGGVIKGNLFENCVNGVCFANSQNHTLSAVGDAVVSCNTFLRPAAATGSSAAIVRDYCQAYYTTDPCTQVNFSTVPGTGGPSIQYNLQKNKFVGTASGDDHFYHVFNSDANAPITYSTFSGIAATIAVNSTTLVQVRNAGIALTAGVNDCAWEGFGYGLQARTSGPSMPDSPKEKTGQEVFMAQNVPNPCTGITSVSYRTPSGKMEVQVVIRDYFSGRVVQRQVVPAGEHTVEVNVSQLPAGSYHYALELDGRPVAHHNLLVQ